MLSELPPPPPLIVAGWHAEAPLALPPALLGAVPDDPMAAGVDQARFVRHHKLGKIGVDVMLVGAGATLVGSVVTVVGLVGCLADVGCGAAAVGVVTVGAGAVAFVTGDVLMFTGAIEAAYDAQRLGWGVTPTVGWVGVGLVAGGWVASTLLVARDPGDPTLDALGFLPLAGVVCGAVQLGIDGHAGRANAALVLAPTPDGLRVAGRF